MNAQPDPKGASRLAIAVIVAAAFHRPMTFWAVNAWELSSPLKLLLVGLGIAMVGIALCVLLIWLGLRPLVAGLAIGALLMLLARWQALVGSTGPLLVGLILVVVWLVEHRSVSTPLHWLAVAFVVGFGFVPVLQLVVSHVRDSTPYALLELPRPEPASASGLIEDVVLVIVDSYPSLQVAENWFGHEPVQFVERLHSRGFTVQLGAWSRHTFTSLSVSGILELRSVIEAGPTKPWGNRWPLWHILRGQNLVSETLGTAGFTYRHIESGWEGTSCGPAVDMCIESPWIDEQVWEIFEPTIVHDWIKDRNYFLTGTFNTAEALDELLPSLIRNDAHDYVFAHFLLPHDPLIVDDKCEPRPGLGQSELDLSSRMVAFSEQMSCVELLLVASVIETVDEDTAVLLTGDHGSGTGGQVGQSPDEWSDADIAERFSVFQAYRLPPSCDPPSLPDPIVAMNAILACAVGETFSTPPPDYVIGFEDTESVEPERMARIQEQVESGALGPDEG